MSGIRDYCASLERLHAAQDALALHPLAATVPIEARRVRLAFDAALIEAREECNFLRDDQFRVSVMTWLRTCRANQVDPFVLLCEEEEP